jgi:hypothetical protein
MMQTRQLLPLLGLVALLTLTACATQSRMLQSIGFPAVAGPISDEEAGTLTAQIRDLKARRDAVRVKLNTEPDASVRAGYYRDIASLSGEVLPLQQRLKDAARPLP